MAEITDREEMIQGLAGKIMAHLYSRAKSSKGNRFTVEKVDLMAIEELLDDFALSVQSELGEEIKRLKELYEPCPRNVSHSWL